MSEIPISIAKDKFAELARRAEAGETMTITRFGKPVMDLVPLKPSLDFNLPEEALTTSPTPKR
ncbi:type II toxin-antitoxin system prevent-host-death family antitoxin [Pararhizobium sp. YC-54]|uniref:type II toxin-antitoxin system Phd/YefM family antitoxin n=1 Tax=Pararhizobium sp. YC-54 TaxID=2986920 RepID=UPI0021F74AD2|nr:type II toxin-antitoxin system prevent-host-death family antitoxin [Pararhizobium sp. YC-54]MCW0001607.1 type II toxin-antitoxin system prevent-host-death family antitoxin [Pararhizobium sp. YC-54]